MDSLSPNLNSDVSSEQHLTPESQPLKKRMVLQKTVVTVKVGSKKAGKLKNEGPPPDFWSWRKYGQKPIKGSPFPRGYYRCSTSKGCSAKKQVEKSKTDGSMFIITYTSSHNHPGPSISTLSLTQEAEDEIEPQPSDQDLPNQEQDKQDHDEKQSIPSDGDAAENYHHFHYTQSPLNCPKEIAIDQEEEEDPLSMEQEKPMEKIRDCLDEGQISCSQLIRSKSEEENDFFDELEELPTPPSFSSVMRSYYFDEIRVPAAPS